MKSIMKILLVPILLVLLCTATGCVAPWGWWDHDDHHGGGGGGGYHHGDGGHYDGDRR